MHRPLGQSRTRAVRLATVALAMSQRSVTLQWLRDELGLYAQARPGTGRAQFERDKDDLARAGLHIDVDGSTYRAVGAAGPSFTDDELDALARVAGLVADPGTGAALAAFAAHADAFPDVTADDRIRAQVPEAGPLLDAVAARRAVTFGYRPVHGPAAPRTVEPWGLRSRRGLWYVVGHDRDRDARRSFRLDRIDGAVTEVGDARTPPGDVHDADVVPPASGPVTLRLAGRGAFDVLRLGGDADPDGPWAQVVTVPDLRDETALGLALAHDAEIVDPPELERERSTRLQMVEDLHLLATPPAPEALDAVAGRDAPLDTARLRRLLALPGWLHGRIGVTVQEAARGLGTTVAELEEDLAVLSEVVLPGLGDVADAFVDEHGVIMHVVLQAVPLRLDASDRARVRSLVQAAAALRAAPAAPLARLQERLDDPVVVAVDPTDVLDDLLLLRDARDERRVVSFLHLGRGATTPQQRRLTPTRIDWSEGHAYVGGHDHDRDAPRWFRLDRVAALEVGEVDAAGRDVDLPEIAYVPVGDETEVVLRCTHVGSWVLQRIPPEVRVDLDDGTVWARLRTDVPEVVADHVVVAGGEAEVVTPADLRASIAERAGRLH